MQRKSTAYIADAKGGKSSSHSLASSNSRLPSWYYQSEKVQQSALMQASYPLHYHVLTCLGKLRCSGADSPVTGAWTPTPFHLRTPSQRYHLKQEEWKGCRSPTGIVRDSKLPGLFPIHAPVCPSSVILLHVILMKPGLLDDPGHTD